jgi:hypothetical protein
MTPEIEQFINEHHSDTDAISGRELRMDESELRTFIAKLTAGQMAEPAEYRYRLKHGGSGGWLRAKVQPTFFCDDDKWEVQPLYTSAPTASRKMAEPVAMISDDEALRLLAFSGKPEEIAGSPEVRRARVRELVRWFVRRTTGDANPKWTDEHANELAYFIATEPLYTSAPTLQPHLVVVPRDEVSRIAHEMAVDVERVRNIRVIPFTRFVAALNALSATEGSV